MCGRLSGALRLSTASASLRTVGPAHNATAPASPSFKIRHKDATQIHQGERIAGLHPIGLAKRLGNCDDSSLRHLHGSALHVLYLAFCTVHLIDSIAEGQNRVKDIAATVPFAQTGSQCHNGANLELSQTALWKSNPTPASVSSAGGRTPSYPMGHHCTRWGAPSACTSGFTPTTRGVA